MTSTKPRTISSGLLLMKWTLGDLAAFTGLIIAK